jgi:uncharacterized cupredoxin-like copper-binding protein
MNRTIIGLTQDRGVRRRHVLTIFAAGAGSAFLAACGGSNATDIPKPVTGTSAATTLPTTIGSVAAGSTVTAAGQSDLPILAIEAVEYGFRTNGSIGAGMTMATMKNLGQEDHQAQFLRLNDGVTLAQVQAAFQTDQRAVEQLTTLVGGPGTAAAGNTSAALMELQAGQYLIACFIPARDGVAHAAKGMVLPLTVTPATVTAPPLPATQGSVVLKEFSFALSTSALPAGWSMISVVNEGAQSHEFGVVRLAPGKSAGDITQYFAGKPAGPPPFVSAGGLTALSPGQRGIAVLDLTPGSYAAICFVPDPASGKSHLQLGMIAGFTAA